MSQDQDHIDLSVDVAFGEPESLRGRQLLRTLDAMDKAVLETVTLFRVNGFF